MPVQFIQVNVAVQVPKSQKGSEQAYAEAKVRKALGSKVFSHIEISANHTLSDGVATGDPAQPIDNNASISAWAIGQCERAGIELLPLTEGSGLVWQWHDALNGYSGETRFADKGAAAKDALDTCFDEATPDEDDERTYFQRIEEAINADLDADINEHFYEISEWAGLHFKKNFPAESPSQQRELMIRYREVLAALNAE